MHILTSESFLYAPYINILTWFIKEGVMMGRESKKALISLETLIIFITVILIAALSAGVLIRNSGVLSQRAFTVSEESRERLVTGVEMVQLQATANLTAETLNNLEILIRLKAGSNPVQLKNLKVFLTTQITSTAGSLSHSTMTDGYTAINISNLSTSWIYIADIEDNSHDTGTTSERIRLVSPNILQINLSYASNNIETDYYNAAPSEANISLGTSVNISDNSSISLVDEPIIVNDMIYGYVQIEGSAYNDSFVAGTNASITNHPAADTCEWDSLIPEIRFCYRSQIGDGDTTLESGELVTLRYRMRDLNYIRIESPYELRLIPKEGAIETLSTKTPSTLVVTKTTLYG